MEIKITSNQILNILYIFTWIIFVGLCIETCGIIFNSIHAFFVNTNTASQVWDNINLAELKKYDKGHFAVLTFLISIIAILKTLIFYLMIRLIHKKRLNFSKPFTQSLVNFVSLVGYLTIGIGFFSSYATNYSKWLIEKGISIQSIEILKIDGAGVWYFMGITLFVIVLIIKKGVEIQSENELTI